MIRFKTRTKYIQVYKYTSIQVYKYTSIQIYKYTIIQVYKYTSIQVYKCASIQVYKYTSIQVYTKYLQDKDKMVKLGSSTELNCTVEMGDQVPQ